jgi:hypothetical protein
VNNALRVGRWDGAVAVLVLGHTSSSAGRVGSSAELALGVLVHDPGKVLGQDSLVEYWLNIPLVRRHSLFRVIEVEVVDEVVLSCHGLGEVVGDIDGGGSGSSRHLDEGIEGWLVNIELI